MKMLFQCLILHTKTQLTMYSYLITLFLPPTSPHHDFLNDDYPQNDQPQGVSSQHFRQGKA